MHSAAEKLWALWREMLLFVLQCPFNPLRPIRNRRHFADDSFKCIFMNENMFISINISLKFIPKGLINYIPALVQTMAWRRPGGKPLFEPMMIISLTHICVTRPQWVKLSENNLSSDYWPAHRAGLLWSIFLVNQEVSLNFHHFCG